MKSQDTQSRKFHVKPSPIEGMGLYASEFLPKGTVWWRADLEDLILVTQRQYALMLAFETSQWPMLTVLQRYTYYAQALDSLIYICDDARYLNHSETPNSAPSGDRLASVTIRDVEQGEELLENYSTYDFCPWANLWGELGRQLGAWRTS